MNKVHISLIILLQLSLLCMTYIPNVNIVAIQVAIYALLLLNYFFARKEMFFVKKRTIGLYLCSLTFISLLFLRIVIDLNINMLEQQIYTSDTTVYFFLINALFLPMLFIPLVKIKKEVVNVYYVFSVLLLICLFVSFYNIVNLRGVLSADHRFGANELLGTIQYGHLGVTSFIMGLTLIQNEKERKYDKCLSVILLSLGIVTVFLAGTRGAFVSLFCCLLFYLIVIKKVKYVVFTAIGIVLIFILKNQIIDYFATLGSNSAIRFYALFAESGDQSSGRMDLYRQAFADFLDNPLLGKAYFFSFSGQPYVHNSLLEVARALGLIGVVMFIWINAKFLLICREIVKQKTLATFFALLYIQYLSFSFFSETLLRLNMYWFSMAMLLCIKHSLDANCLKVSDKYAK